MCRISGVALKAVNSELTNMTGLMKNKRLSHLKANYEQQG